MGIQFDLATQSFHLQAGLRAAKYSEVVAHIHSVTTGYFISD